jgi:hypothetical protein
VSRRLDKESFVRKSHAALVRTLHAPGVRQGRTAAELAVTPHVRLALHRVDLKAGDLERRLDEQSVRMEQLGRAVADIEANMPAVLNAIASMSGAARLVKRELDVLRTDLESFRSGSDALHQQFAADIERARTDIKEGDLDVLGQVRPHAETLAWLMQRVETVRFEMLNELRYGSREGGRTAIEPRVVNPAALERSPLKLNIGAGHIPLDGYVNVDMRELPGIDVVATVDELPFEPGTLDEIFSSHTLEHFPHEVLRRQLLPYWSSLLKPGGTLVTIAPDIEAMSSDYARGDTSFDDFREVLYGAQEYEGDTHFTGFTPDSFSKLLAEAGYVDVQTVVCDRRNGKCKEFEITARKSD